MCDTARAIFLIRLRRHAQIEGLMKCAVGMPASLRAISKSRLKSGASTPTNTPGRSSRSCARSESRMPLISR